MNIYKNDNDLIFEQSGFTVQYLLENINFLLKQNYITNKSKVMLLQRNQNTQNWFIVNDVFGIQVKLNKQCNIIPVSMIFGDKQIQYQQEQ